MGDTTKKTALQQQLEALDPAGRSVREICLQALASRGSLAGAAWECSQILKRPISGRVIGYWLAEWGIDPRTGEAVNA